MSVTTRQLVVAVLQRAKGRAVGARQVTQFLAKSGYQVELRDVALELERLYREGSARRGRDGAARVYQIVSLPQKAPGTIKRVNHLRRTWRDSDSCARKSVALTALKDEFADLASRPVKGRSGADAQKAKAARNKRYRSELKNKAAQTRDFCARSKVGN
ncbi:MAG: hypothetical protein AB8I08_33040 [Sandaracinaceae bacterium]